MLEYPTRKYSAYGIKFTGYFFIFIVVYVFVSSVIRFASNGFIENIIFPLPFLLPLLLIGIILSSIDVKKSIEDYRTRKMADDVYKKKVQKKNSSQCTHLNLLE